MSDYFDCVQFKKTKNDKPFAVKLGSAKKREDGGFNLYLDAMPAPVNGQFELQIVPQRERMRPSPAGTDDLNEPMPF